MTQEKDRIGVLVFVEVEGEGDYLDKSHVAEIAVKRALGNGHTLAPYPIELERTPYFRDGRGDKHPQVTVHQVRELGIACGNGYTWVKVTSKAYPREEIEDAG